MSLKRAPQTPDSNAALQQETSSRSNVERQFDPDRIKELNEKYRPLSIEGRVSELYKDFAADKVMLTSSFAATSAFLLHVFSRFAPGQPVFFIDTGYHFPQTLEYKQK